MIAAGKHFGVVVGLDESGYSDEALRWAAHEAALRKERLTLVHAITIPTPAWPALQLRELYEDDGRAILEDAVRDVKESTKSDGPLDVTLHLEFSRPAPTLIDMSKDADLVVVGARGLGTVRQLLLGSVSSALVHHAHCPVVVIHQDAALYPQATGAPVLLGTDGSQGSELATRIAFQEASLRGVELIALHAVSDADIARVPTKDRAAAHSSAGELLTEQLAGWEKRFPDVHVQRVLADDRPATHLLDLADKAQLVVVGTHGRGGFAGMMLGSVSTAVAQASSTPVMVTRGQ